MNHYLEKLARRAVARAKWRWTAGMLDSNGCRLIRESLKEGSWMAVGSNGRVHCLYTPALPDFSDTATLGCLLVLIRTVWEEPSVSMVAVDTGEGSEEWDVIRSEGETLENYSPEMLVRALEELQ